VLVEWAWLLRWKGESPSSPPHWAGAQDYESLTARLSEVQADRASFLASLKEIDLGRPITYRNIKGEQSQSILADLLLHLVNHSTYHRGQLTTLLRQLGSTPLATDLLLFRREVSS